MPSKKPGGAKQARNPDEPFQPPILSIFEFTPQDLRSNERGYITDRQRAWLRSNARGIRSCSMTSAVIGLGFAIFGMLLTLGLYLQNEDSRAALFSNSMNLPMLAGGLIAAVSILGLSIWFARRQASAVEEAALRKVQGTVRLDQDYSPGSAITSYHVLIGDQKFSFTEDVSRVFKEGSQYSIYFCRSGPYRLILSMEQQTPQG